MSVAPPGPALSDLTETRTIPLMVTAPHSFRREDVRHGYFLRRGLQLGERGVHDCAAGELPYVLAPIWDVHLFDGEEHVDKPDDLCGPLRRDDVSRYVGRILIQKVAFLHLSPGLLLV